MGPCLQCHPFPWLPGVAYSRVLCSEENLECHSLSIASFPHPTRRTSCVPTRDAPVGQPRRDYTECACWQARQNPIAEVDSRQGCARPHDYSPVQDTLRCKSM